MKKEKNAEELNQKKRKVAYLKTEEEGRLDEYYEELREKRQFF